MHRFFWGTALCGLLLAGSSPAAESEEQAIRTTIARSAEGWSTLNPDTNDPYYTSSDQAVFFDVAPMEYIGWKSYKEGFKKAFANFQDFKLTLNNDLAVHRRGNISWATTTWKADGHLKDGKVAHLEGRATLVLEKREGKWKIVHEHYSVPASM